MKKLIPAVLLLLSGCEDVCRQMSGYNSGPTRIRVNTAVEYDARRAGVSETELRSVTEQVLRSHGVSIAGPSEQTNYSVDVSVRVLDPGMRGYVGMIALTVREPATLWATGAGVQAITSTQQVLFSTPERRIGNYTGEHLRDAVEEMIEQNPRLAARR